MAIHFCSCRSRIILYVILIFLSVRAMNSRKMIHHMPEIDPSLNVFFTISDLKIGKEIPIFFPNKSNSPHLLSRQVTNSIPFSSKHLSYLLKLFSFPLNSPQAKAVQYTLNQCETDPKIQSETKLCVTSLESMLDFVRVTFGSDTEFKALTTNYGRGKRNFRAVPELRKYKIVEEPREVEVVKKSMVSCHVMPYPYVVYYCHSRSGGGNRVFEIVLSSGEENENERVEAAAICHMDTSKWDANHVSFRLLKIKPGSNSPVCHFLPADNVVWVPLN